MQLKLRRSQRDGGAFSSNVVFCLDARAEYTSSELSDIRRYKLQNQVVYNSEASKRLLDKGGAVGDGSTRGALKSLAFTALAAMRLNITIGSLQKGHHIECKSLDELLGAESALTEACENLTGYLDAAASFDGREVVIDFASGKPQVAAVATPPQAQLMSSLPPEPSAPALEHADVRGSGAGDAGPAPVAEYQSIEQTSPLEVVRLAWADEDMRRAALVTLGLVLIILLVAKCS